MKTFLGAEGERKREIARQLDAQKRGQRDEVYLWNKAATVQPE